MNGAFLSSVLCSSETKEGQKEGYGKEVRYGQGTYMTFFEKINDPFLQSGISDGG